MSVDLLAWKLYMDLFVTDLKDKEICPVFSQFSFLSWSLDSEKENISPNNILPVLPPEDSDFAFDVNAVPEPLPPEDNDIPPDNFEDSDKFGSTGTSGATTNTAGDGSEMVACRKQKQRQKKELLVELDKNDISFIVEKNTSILKLTKRTMQKVWSADKNTHPPDMHYDIKRFAQKDDAITDQEEKKELVGSLGEKKLPTEGFTERNDEWERVLGIRNQMIDDIKIYGSYKETKRKAENRRDWRKLSFAVKDLPLGFVSVFVWLLPSKETLRGHSDSSFRGEGYIQCCVGVRLCDMYSNQELAEIHFMYGKADSNAALARRLYQERYPQRQCPDRKTFVRLHYRLCEYGKFNSPGLGRGRPRSTTPEVQEEILEAVNMTPSISTRRVALQVRFSLNMWAGIIGNRLVGPHVLVNRFTGQAYTNFLENTIPHVLEDTPLINRQHIHFLHDGAPAHFSKSARWYLDRRFRDRWIGRGGPIAWPPCSPDLNPLDFYLWGHLKSLVYSSPVPDLESLRNRIVACSEYIRNTLGVWDRVRRSMRHRSFEYTIRKAKVLAKGKGILCSPNPKPGKPLLRAVASKVKEFCCSDEISRMMPVGLQEKSSPVVGLPPLASEQVEDTAFSLHLMEQLLSPHCLFCRTECTTGRIIFATSYIAFQIELTKYRVIGVHSIPYEDDQSADYNYENDHDTSEYCPNVANDDLDDGDDGPVDDMLPSQQDVHNSFVLEGSGHLDAFQGDNLVAPPNKVLAVSKLIPTMGSGPTKGISCPFWPIDLHIHFPECLDALVPTAALACYEKTEHSGFVSVFVWLLSSKETLRGHSDSSFRGEGYIQCCVGVRLCDMYSNQELAEIHFMYGKADGNAALARRLYQERYPQRQCPDRKTFHVWAYENPRATIPSHHQVRFSLNMWAGIIGDRLVGPHVLVNRFTGQAYTNFLENTIPHVLEDTPLINRQHIHFLHDGAPAHFSRTARWYLDRRFRDRWIGRGGPIAWPPCSPDLNPLDFYLWGHLKSLVYSSPVPDLESLRNRIVACSEYIRNTLGVWDRVRRSMRHRCEVCIQAGGGHFEHLLK
ncbi:hypothetical protein ANN_01086 [Periplaneta americana]|uniref:DUF4817 domain-containing protein n=1 Tax=Periplaneta americana TaxID=6978 RepID=A0ABQ8TSN1_PERAM|nr:hypothetical protein ANN_01086 [Periplaneta americana]